MWPEMIPFYIKSSMCFRLYILLSDSTFSALLLLYLYKLQVIHSLPIVQVLFLALIHSSRLLGPSLLAYIPCYFKYMKSQWIIQSNIDHIQNMHVILTLLSFLRLAPKLATSAAPTVQPMAQVYQARRNCKLIQLLVADCTTQETLLDLLQTLNLYNVLISHVGFLKVRRLS